VEAVLVSLARLLPADWIALTRKEDRIEVRGEGRVVRRGESSAPRDVDSGLLQGLEPGRVVAFGTKTLRSWPRTAGSGLSQVVAYATRDRPPVRLLAGTKDPAGLDTRRFEELARFALAVIELDQQAPAEEDSALETACTTHDLRHLLTVALLDIERAAADGGSSGALERVRATLSEARALCETSRGDREILFLPPILDAAARDAETGSGRRGRVAVRVRCAADLALRVDRNLLERALRNLLSNAIEATPDGGEVELEAASQAGGEITLSIRDEGRGIARDELRDLLRAGRSGSGGSGLGTASARDCVRGLGGKLLVRSRPRAGTEFVIRLPQSSRERT
jgi:signal transduction histidine kinase